MKEKKALSVGDRVAVYGYDANDGLWEGEHATVKEVNHERGLEHLISVRDEKDPRGETVTVHRRQCVRLIRKPRRRAFLNVYHDGEPSYANGFHKTRADADSHAVAGRTGCIEFVEVRGGK